MPVPSTAPFARADGGVLCMRASAQARHPVYTNGITVLRHPARTYNSRAARISAYRKPVGHWEDDTISGCWGSCGLLSLIVRMSCQCVLRIVPNMRTAIMARAMIAALGNLPAYSILLNMDPEFAKHCVIAFALQTNLYFADFLDLPEHPLFLAFGVHRQYRWQ